MTSDLVDVGVVITTCAGREENLLRVLKCLDAIPRAGAPNDTPWELPIAIVYDGCHALGLEGERGEHGALDIGEVEIPKHGPGMEQPRNVGFRRLVDGYGLVTHAWFLDSDMIFLPDILDHFECALKADPDRILVGPYDWLAPGVTVPDGPLEMEDPRWPSFKQYAPDEKLVGELGSALACFGGNLVWPVERFKQVGGFHPDLHHGRCEDGELGLRAASAGVPISFITLAKCWHVWHSRDYAGATQKNLRDVPLLNSWHPWVEGEGLVLSHEDGARFDWQCPECGEQVNSLAYWVHNEQHRRELVHG